MGQVTMDLSELDKIREDLKIANLEIGKRNQTIKEKDEEIVKIQVGKRTLKVTVKQVPMYGVDIYNQSGMSKGEFKWNLDKIFHSYINSHRIDHNGLDYAIGKEIDKFTNNPRKFELATKEETTTEYINMEDVISQIRTESEAKLGQDLGNLRASVSSLTDKLAEANSKKNDEITKLKNDQNDQLNKVKDQFDKDYLSLRKSYDDLKADKDTRTLEQQILDLKLELNKIRNRGFIKRVFNSK